MRQKHFRRHRLLPVIYMLVLLLIGCTVPGEPSATEPAEPQVILRILTESTTVDGMKSQILEMMSLFEKEHKNVNLILDVLPQEGLERQKAVSQIYVDISEGNGPDIYLMQNGSAVTVSSGSYLTKTAEPLFDNVTEHMYKGTFADISSYYDADAALDKAGLVAGVMNAGVVDDARYILPLRYSIPVIYADRDALADTVLTEDILNSGIYKILSTVVPLRDTKLSASVDPVRLHSRYLFNFFSELANYKTYKINLQNGTLYTYMEKAFLNHAYALQAESSPNIPHIGSYISNGEYFTQGGFPLVLGPLESALDAAAIAKALGIDLAMLPLRGMDGKLIADVTYFGAVGADCENPELAYDFLRLFLMPDAQWEVNRPRSTMGFQPGLIAAGWPVRAEGSVEYLWQNMEFQLGFYMGKDAEWKSRAEGLNIVELTDADLSSLFTAVDGARFNHPVESQGNYDMIPNYHVSWGFADAFEICHTLEAHMSVFRRSME